MMTNPDHDHPINYSKRAKRPHAWVLSHTIVGVLPQLITVEVSNCIPLTENHIALITNTSSFKCILVSSDSQYSLGLEKL